MGEAELRAAQREDEPPTSAAEPRTRPLTKTQLVLQILARLEIRRAPSGALFTLSAARPTPLREHVQALYVAAHGDVAPQAAVRAAVASLGDVEHMTEGEAAVAEPHRSVHAAGDGRPGIVLGPELHENVADGVKALKADPEIFHRDAQLVHVVHVDADALDGGASWAVGTPQIRALPLASLRVSLSRVARWMSVDRRSKQIVQVSPSGHVAEAIHAQGEWPLRPLVGILEAPSFRPNGTMIDVPGYDAATGYLYQPSAAFPRVTPAPSQAAAAAALATLREIFAEFPYVGDGGAEVPLAAILTLIARPMIAGSVPAFLFDATGPGSGKSLATDVIATVATGRRSPRMNWPTQEEEVEKVVAGFAMRGAAMVNFDNAKRPFGGATIERVLTATDRVGLRVLGYTDVRELRWRALIMASGNNMAVEGETIRRCLLCRLEPTCERPEERAQFVHPDLLAWVTAQRPRLVAAACTMIAAWVHAGRPVAIQCTWGSFEPWADVVPHVLSFAGAGDVMRARLTLRDEGHDSEVSAIVVVMKAIERLGEAAGGRITAKGLVTALYPPLDAAERRGGRPPDDFEDAREAIESLVRVKPGQPPSARELGKALGSYKGRVIGGRKLDSKAGQGGLMKWWVTGA